jgi:hypothetical protein
LNVILIFSTIVFCVQKFDRFLDNQLKKSLFLLFSLPVFFFCTWISCGMEAGLVIVATVFFIWFWNRAEENDFTDRRRNLRLGGAIAFLFLSRLDMILVLAPFVLFIFYRLLRKGSGMKLVHATEIFGLPLFFGGIYLATNIYYTGHFVPISGVAKRLLSEPSRVTWEGLTGGDPISSLLPVLPILGSLTIFVCASIPRFRRSFAPMPLNGIVLLNIGLVVFYLYLLFFAFFAWHYFFWYFAFPEAALLVTAALLAGRIAPKQASGPTRGHFWAWALVFALLFNVSANVYFLNRLVPWKNNTSYQLLQVARQVDKICGPDAVIGTFDAGIVGFFTRARVINLDGLANNYTYLKRYLEPRRIKAYFARQGVTYFLVAGEFLINRAEVRSGKYTRAFVRKDGRIELTRDKEVFRYKIPGWSHVYLYALNKEPGVS